MKYTVLFADNDSAAREYWGTFLRESGYIVRLASTPQEAQNELGTGRIDLAVIDVRLKDDNLESDISGLKLAADEAFRHIPKIILTAFQMSYKEQREVWQAVGGKPPAVVAFVGKEEGPRDLLDEIRYAFKAWPLLSRLASKVSDRIESDHETTRSQARRSYLLSLGISLFGFIVIVVGIALAAMGRLEIGIIGPVTGLILEAIGYLFFKRLDHANRRMDVYHQELLQTYGVEFLLSVAERLPAERQNVCVEQVIHAVVSSWYPAGAKSDTESVSDPFFTTEADAGPGADRSQP